MIFARKAAVSVCLLGVLYGATLILWGGLWFWQGWLGLAVTPALIWTSVTDLDNHEIPNLATLAIALLGLTALTLAPNAAPIATIILAVLVLSGLWWLGHLYWRRTGREALGIGDAKLLAAGTLMVGAERFWLMLLLASVGGIVAALVSRKDREEGIPFGPFIAYAIFVTFTMSDPVP